MSSWRVRADRRSPHALIRLVLKQATVTTVKGGVCNPCYFSCLKGQLRVAPRKSSSWDWKRATSVPGQHAEIGLSWREKEDKPTVFKYCAYCCSCKKFALNNGWAGRATYDSSTFMLTMCALPISTPGNFDRTQNASEHGLLPIERRLVIENWDIAVPKKIRHMKKTMKNKTKRQWRNIELFWMFGGWTPKLVNPFGRSRHKLRQIREDDMTMIKPDERNGSQNAKKWINEWMHK